MEDIGETGKASSKPAENSLVWVIAILFLALIIFMSMKYLGNNQNSPEPNICNDGTSFDKCSQTKPYYCMNKTLVRNPSLCGCPETFNFSKEGDACTSNYQSGMKNISLRYVIDRKEGA